MATDPHLTAIEDALSSLKDFQRDTVGTVYDRLFRKKQKSMLVADEVGLGKTVVAKGIIARALRERRLRQCGRRRGARDPGSRRPLPDARARDHPWLRGVTSWTGGGHRWASSACG